MDETTYLAQSARTESKSYHYENVPPAEVDRMMDAVEAATAWVDRVKRALYYGKPIELKASHSSHTSVRHNPELAQMLHGMLGLFSEAGELIQHLHSVLAGNVELDSVNLIEELGDIYWYAAVLHRITGSLPSDAWRANIKKLEARYPQGFNAGCAYNRDTQQERAVLEQHAVRQEEND